MSMCQDNEFDFQARTRLVLGELAFARLQQVRVLVVGVGGVGGWCAEALVRSGVSHLTIVDSDCVQPSNINRQLMATSQTIGQPKVDALKQLLLTRNPQVQIVALPVRYDPQCEMPNELRDLSVYDFVIDAIDSVACKAALIRTALAIPSVTLLSSMGAAGRIDPFRIKHTTFAKVTGDGLARALRQRFKREGLWPQRNWTCVWSDEPAVNRGMRTVADGLANGSLMPVTATFGLALASLVVQAVIRE